MTTDLQPYEEVIKNAPLYQLRLVQTNALVVSNYNPRAITEESLAALKKSMTANTDFLKARPIIVNKHPGREGVVIGGNMRLRAAMEMGWPKVPVMFVDVDETKEKVWNILDNKNQGEWNEDKLHTMVMELHGARFDLSSIGFKPQELVTVMKFNAAEPKDNPDSSKGSTPRKKKDVVCPNCSHHFAA